MTWQEKGRRAAMGQFVRAKAERMVLFRFDGEPTTAWGTNYQKQKVEELHFPVTFWDERSVGLRYKEGEALRICTATAGEVKIFPVSSPPLMRELLMEDESESVLGRTFILSHTGVAADTSYKFREVRIPRHTQKLAVADENEEQDVAGVINNNDINHESSQVKEAPVKITAQRNPVVEKICVDDGVLGDKREDVIVETKDRPINGVVDEKDKFIKAVKKRAKKVKELEMIQDLPSDSMEPDDRNNDEIGE